MAKRKSKQSQQQDAFEKRRAIFVKIGWALVVGVSILFGYSYGSPLIAEGEVVRGILTGLAYGGGALLALLVSLYLNRKLKGY